MAKCDGCGTTILFGGVKDGGYRFCNEKCHQKAPAMKLAAALPADDVLAEARKVHAGTCPKCSGAGPVDIHTSHTIFSVVYVTSWNSKPHLCCRACGRKEQAKALALSTFLGWWGFPWGILFTPVQIGKNIAGMTRGPKPEQPSPELEKIVRTMMAQRQLAAQSAGAAPIPAQAILTSPIPDVPLPKSTAARPQSTPQGSPFSNGNPFN
jgi:hypothetical protein